MLLRTFSILFLFLLFSFQNEDFKQEQLKYSRVRQAYKEKEESIKQLLSEKQINQNELRIYLRAFKQESELELWAKSQSDQQFSLLKTYEICASSGSIGPKREQGDLQVPEGFYHIDRFNPYSSYHLSLGINYPNRSDKILGVKDHLGGDIFIHGSCVTIGCLPITDEQIKELYLFCVEAKSNGQTVIPVSIFPTHLSESNFQLLKNENYTKDQLELWEDLKKGYQSFNENKKLPSIGFLNSGRHTINP
ncbi:L,D-transpeptidase family protein [Flammeovirga pacifica]|uniref:L,D-TPase catalytic domain-containing protein n=1 Tax=Flammeovirga pacifica TaxID=915059 RepID=A0A1S1Z5Y2_FLAPC|nr:L,D-transpeptidase family protein [Flammeovirga pacifica]OHX68622.1 hypothetical protein NH26_18645 [Flammeovirga pacifica]